MDDFDQLEAELAKRHRLMEFVGGPLDGEVLWMPCVKESHMLSTTGVRYEYVFATDGNGKLTMRFKRAVQTGLDPHLDWSGGR